MTAEKKRSEVLRELLELEHLNVEAGLFSLVMESSVEISRKGAPFPASNAIYLMLDDEEPVNYVQWLASDDYQICIEGGPADYYLFYEDGTSEKITMGSDIENGQRLIVPAPGGTAKAIELHDDADYLLIASVVTPAWTPGQVRIGGDDAFVDKYLDSSPWASCDKIKQLIGPNFGYYIGGRNDELVVTIQKDGQLIFQDMQLSPDQLRSEYIRFQAIHPEAVPEVISEQGAPSDQIELVRAILFPK